MNTDERPQARRRGLSRRAAVATIGTAAIAGAALGTGSAARTTQAAPGQEIVGSWIGDGSVSGGLLYTFTADGGLIGSSAQHLSRTPVHGAWVRTGERQFLGISMAIRFDATGAPIGHVKNRTEYWVDPSGDRLTSRTIREHYNLAGALQESIEAGAGFTRLVPEPLR